MKMITMNKMLICFNLNVTTREMKKKQRFKNTQNTPIVLGATAWLLPFLDVLLFFFSLCILLHIKFTFMHISTWVCCTFFSRKDNWRKTKIINLVRMTHMLCVRINEALYIYAFFHASLQRQQQQHLTDSCCSENKKAATKYEITKKTQHTKNEMNGVRVLMGLNWCQW